MNKIEVFLWKTISYLLIPPFVSFFAFLILLKKSGEFYKSTILIGSLFLLVLPISLFLILRYKGIIKDNDASNPKERVIPFITGIIFHLSALISFYFISQNTLLILLFTVLIALTLLILFINNYWKISSHLIYASSSFAIAFKFYNDYFLIGLIAIILLSVARYRLNMHSLLQIIAGMVLGFSITTIIFNIWS